MRPYPNSPNHSIPRLAAFAILLLTLLDPVLAQKNEAEARALAAYPLTMDLVSRYYLSTRDLTRLIQTDPDLKRQLDGWDDLLLDSRIRKLEATPKVLAVLKARGISPRDHAMTGAAVLAAMIVVANLRGGAKGPNDSNKLEWAATPPDHVKFYQTHQEEIKKLQQSFIDVIRK